MAQKSGTFEVKADESTSKSKDSAVKSKDHSEVASKPNNEDR
jgi:hypothetical protein